MSIRSLIRTTFGASPVAVVKVAALATLLSACEMEPVAAPQVPVEPPEIPVALEWQEQASELVATNRLSALAAGRVYAALSMAQYRAVTRVDVDYPVSDGEPPMFASPSSALGGRTLSETRRGAVGGASARVLGVLFPAAADQLALMLEELGSNPGGSVHPHYRRGIAAGRAEAESVVQHLQNDGFTAQWDGTVPVGPGKWIPTSLPPAGVMLGSVTPWLLASGSQFRPAPPPEYRSAAFDIDAAEVVSLSQSRTEAQLAFAKYWDFSAGTPTPIGYWNGTAAGYIANHGLDEAAATKVFALMHAAVFDALIGCWDAKYHYWLLRPSQAVEGVDLAFNVPNFPAYPSGHSCASASAAKVLTYFFPGRASELAKMVEDAGLSRILAGIHYRFDVTAGQQLGDRVAEWALEKGLE